MDITKASEDMSDAQIISKVLSGETEYYEVIVRRYNGYLYKVGKSYGYEHSDIEDLMQETYVNAYRHLKGFEFRSSFKTWLVKIMLHQCYHKKQKLSFKNEMPSSDFISEAASPIFEIETKNGEKAAENTQLKEIIEDAILKLPENYRIVFTLRELNQLSTAETAKLLELTESNVKVRLNRAKKMLQEQIEEVYDPKDLFDFNLIYCDGMTHKVFSKIALEENNC